MKSVVQKVLQNPNQIPPIPQKITKADIQIAEDAVRQHMSKKIQVNILRFVLAEAYDLVENPDFIKPILDVVFLQIEQTPFANEAKLRICEGIIKADQVMRAHTVENYLKQFESQDKLEPSVKARLQAIRSGLHFLHSEFLKAANKILIASRQPYYASNLKIKMNFVEKAIAFAFISQKNAEQHQFICGLYVNQFAKKSELYPLLKKLHSEQMITPQEINPLRKLLPLRISQKDIDNVTIISKAVFAHNMLSILKGFSCVSIKTVSQLIGVNEEEVLLMIEKTYRNQQLKVDLVNGYIEINDDDEREQLFFKKWFQKIQGVLQSLSKA